MDKQFCDLKSSCPSRHNEAYYLMLLEHAITSITICPANGRLCVAFPMALGMQRRCFKTLRPFLYTKMKIRDCRCICKADTNRARIFTVLRFRSTSLCSKGRNKRLTVVGSDFLNDVTLGPSNWIASGFLSFISVGAFKSAESYRWISVIPVL